MNYVSIKSVLAQLALIIDDRYWNETAVLEHATRAMRTLNLEDKFEQKVAIVEIITHKGHIPNDFKFLTQAAFNAGTTSNPVWSPIRLTTNPFHTSICLTDSITRCDNCSQEFSMSPSGVITTTLDSGNILLSYLAYPQDEEGFALIPDNEDVKEAILHFVLYKYWLQKDMMKEEGAEKRMRFHLQMWGTLSKKALSLNLPDISKMENLKNIHNKLVPRSNAFQQLFQFLGDRENVKF